MRRLLLVAIVAFGVTPPAWAGGPRMSLGAAEDIVRAPDLVAAKAKMSVLRLTGFDAARVTSIWAPGQVAPSQTELTTLSNVTTAARLAGVRVYLSVYNARPPAPPRPAGRAGGDRRQRAEPQPLLAAAIHPGRHQRRRTRLPGAAHGDVSRDHA